jgi:hypothetical protein
MIGVIEGGRGDIEGGTALTAEGEVRPAHLRALLCLSEARRLSAYLRQARGADYLWPGFDFGGVPICVYQGGVDALLVQHPDPPGEFQRVQLPIPGLEGVGVFYARGPLPYLPVVGSAVIGGHLTATLPLPVFSPEAVPEGLVAALIHEAFHAFSASGRRRPPDASMLSAYPELSAPNNALGNLEGLILHDILLESLAHAPPAMVATTAATTAAATAATTAATTAAATAAATAAYRFCLVRRERRGPLDETVVEYEQDLEADEGRARYVQTRSLLGALWGRPAANSPPYLPGPAFQTLSGREAYDKAPELITEQIAKLRRINLNAAGAAWWRFFHTGMALALFADYLDPDWKRRVDAGQSLDAVIERGLVYDGGSGDEREIELVKTRYGYDERLAAEREFGRQEKRRKEGLLATLLAGSGRRVTFDVSSLTAEEEGEASGRFSLVWDPAEVEIITQNVRIHRRGLRFVGSGTDLAFSGVPVVEDLKNRLFHVNVRAERLDVEGDGRAQAIFRPAEFAEGLEVSLPGVVARATRGFVRNIDGTLYIKITR